jgi:hypothetical protein
MIATKREIKKAFAELQKIEHEMTLIDYASSDEESSIRERIVQLNSMSLKFVMNDQKQEKITNIAAQILSEDYFAADLMNIATAINEADSMNIAATISEANLMNFSQDTNEKDVIENIIAEKNPVHAERLRRQTLLKRIISSKDAEEDSNIMKKSSSSRKKLILKNLSAKFKKKLKNQALKKLRSFREKDDMNVKINERIYHVKMIIKHLHSCARFLFNNLRQTLEFTKSSIKSTKSITNKQLIKIFCDIVLDSTENKI